MTYGWFFVAYSQFVFLLVVEIRFGPFACGGKSAWSLLLMVPPVRKVDLVFVVYGSPP